MVLDQPWHVRRRLNFVEHREISQTIQKHEYGIHHSSPYFFLITKMFRMHVLVIK